MLLPEPIQNGLLDAVRFAARTEIMPRFRNLPEGAIETKAHADDLVTIADKRAEAVISARAADLMPDALIVGEEAVAQDASLLDKLRDADTAVVIDPIDGTSNFATGLATFGVLLAVRRAGQTVFGLLYDPVFDDWIVAEPGQGAHYVKAAAARRRLHLSGSKPVDKMTGYVPLYLFSKAQQPQIAAAYPKFKRITTQRCSCHEYRMMAQGYTDFTVNAVAHPWDHAAGSLVMEECGGSVVAADGQAYDPAAPQAPLWVFAFQDKARQADVIKTLLG